MAVHALVSMLTIGYILNMSKSTKVEHVMFYAVKQIRPFIASLRLTVLRKALRDTETLTLPALLARNLIILQRHKHDAAKPEE